MIGIYGGTFNPVHYGHLRTALEVKELFALDELRLLPCALPAHRENPSVNAQMRLEMLQIAIKDYVHLRLDTREIQRPGVSYMVDTLTELRKELGNTPIILFMGTDAFNGISSWHRWQELFHYAHIVVMTRPQFKPSALPEFYDDRLVTVRESLKSCVSGKIFFQKVRDLDISASDIRNAFIEQKNPSFLLPEPIIEYIRAHNLYSA
ncbi:MAG: nicotinate-nucleotide adenylyltransferase [Methyloprofundus sp.]|nr:nicotinate-nucleotide adenylyltransferase [Methyloprofundus sp.]